MCTFVTVGQFLEQQFVDSSNSFKESPPRWKTKSGCFVVLFDPILKCFTPAGINVAMGTGFYSINETDGETEKATEILPVSTK